MNDVSLNRSELWSSSERSVNAQAALGECRIRSRASDRSRIRVRTMKVRYAREAIATGRNSMRRVPLSLRCKTNWIVRRRKRSRRSRERRCREEEETHAWREGWNVIGRARCTVIETHSRCSSTTADSTYSETWGTLMIIARSHRWRYPISRLAVKLPRRHAYLSTMVQFSRDRASLLLPDNTQVPKRCVNSPRINGLIFRSPDMCAGKKSYFMPDRSGTSFNFEDQLL